jgi:UDP-2,3-diacylglucosamine pyrophosphatase LpxH
VPTASFVRYLESKSEKFSDLSTISETVDYLTVDDATYAGVEACKMAIKYGHKVVLFINPWQIINRKPYYFNLLNSIIDNREVDVYSFANRKFDLLNRNDVKTLRFLIKKQLIKLSEDDALTVVLEHGFKLKSKSTSLPKACSTISLSDLRELSLMGVQIGSHGWSHRSISALTQKELENDILKSFDWISDNVDKLIKVYAVPFGAPTIPPQLEKKLKITSLLSDKQFNVGRASLRSWNRIEITDLLRSEYEDNSSNY